MSGQTTNVALATEDYTLQPIIGKRRDRQTGRVRKVSTGWDRLLKDGVLIANVHRHSDAPVCPVRHLSPEEAADALAAINRLRAAAGSPYAPSTRCGKYISPAAEQAAHDIIERRPKQQADGNGDGDAVDTELADDGDGDEFVLD